MSDGEISQKFLEKYDEIPERDRESLTIEVIALAAGVDARALLGEILLAAREHSVNRVKLLAVEAHPDVMEKRIEYAKTPGGYRDRDALDTILGALPRSKTTFIDKFYAGSETQAPDLPDSEGEGEEEETKAEAIREAAAMVEDENFVFPDSEVMQERVTAALKQKQLKG